MSAVPDGWEMALLGDLCRIELGSTPARGNARFWDTDKATENVWLSISDMLNSKDAVVTDSREYVSDAGAKQMRLIPSGTLLVSFKLTLGRLCYAGRDLYTNEAIAALLELDHARLSKEYLYWYLTFFDWDAASEGDEKVKGKTLNKAKLKVLPIIIPPLDEQKRIVAVLDQAFVALDRARTNAEANLAASTNIQGAWLRRLFEGSEAWPTHALADICQNLDRLRVPITKGDREPGDIPYYGASGVVDHVKGHLFDEDLLLVSEDGANLLARTYPIAFSISGKAWVNNHAHVLRFDDSTTQEFVRLYLNSISLKPYVTGMAQPKLNQAALNAIPVPMPSGGMREEIVRKAHQISVEAERAAGSYRTQCADLAALRQSLLQAAFSGQLS